MTGQVLGRGVVDDVGAERQRPLAERRGERVVHHEQRPLAASPGLVREAPGYCRDVDDAQVRIGRRLQPDDARRRVEDVVQHCGLVTGECDVLGRNAHFVQHALEVTERSAVHVVDAHDRLSRFGQARDDLSGRGAGREGEAVWRALQRCDRRLESGARRIASACVLPASARPSDTLLGERCGLVDRWRDSPGQLVGSSARVDGDRAGPQVGSMCSTPCG